MDISPSTSGLAIQLPLLPLVPLEGGGRGSVPSAFKPASMPTPTPPPSSAVQPGLPALEQLHPALWRAHQLGRPQGAQPGVLASGHAALDAELPGGGWPAGTLTELLLPHPGVGELRLLAPALSALQRRQRSLMWFDPPAAPCPWALGALGLDVRQLVVVQSRPSQAAVDALWALEQALKCGHLGGVLAWLPARRPADALRRLQLAAQAHDGPVFLLRDAQQRSRPSAAPLRLLLSSAGPDQLRVGVLKRRGPPLAQPLLLALPQVLSAPAYARAQVAQLALAGAGGVDGVRRALPGASAQVARAAAHPASRALPL